MTHEDNRLYEMVTFPLHKSLEFFIPPVIKMSNYAAVKFFDRNPEFFDKVQPAQQNITVKRGENFDIIYRNQGEEDMSPDDLESGKDFVYAE